MENYKEHISICFELIEKKLARGPRMTWDTNDFNALSESIQETTGTLLSVTTLKRLSGNVSYTSRPNNTTINALARYVGFKNWSEFLNDKNNVEYREEVKTDRNNLSKYGVPILVLIISLVVFLMYSQRKKSYDPNDFGFESRPVSSGIPNSVVFDYDVSVAKNNSKIEIQQYWDETKRMTIEKTDSVATSVYYHPGFFKSKLLIDRTVVKENDVFIPTEGWLGIIEKEDKPIYLTLSDIKKEDRMAITPEIVGAHDMNPRTDRVIVSFYQVKDFGELYTDNFEMSATIKNDYSLGVSGACQGAQIYILYDGGAIGIPLAKKGCSSDLTLMTFEKFVDGKKNDLSDFGVDFVDYVELKCVSKNNQLQLFIDNKPIYKMKVPEPAVKIKGISIHFEGAGSIKNVEFKKGQEMVYSSNFNDH